MLKLSEKQTLTVHNKMELGEDISVEAKGKGRKFVSRFIEPGVAHYEEFGDVLITKETLDGFINTMVGCPVIIQHKDIDDENVDKERVGVISNVWFNEFDGWYYCDGIIWDKQAIDLIKNQDWSVSCTYDFDSDKLEKTHNGKKIDMEFTGGEFLHLALVPNPRYERANIVMNAKEKDDDVEWITVHGNHIPVKKGQSKDEAIKEFIDKQQNKSSDKKETPKDKSGDKKNKEYDLQSTLEMKIDSHYDDDFITKEYANEMSELLGTKITEDDIWDAMEKSRPSRGSADYDIQKMSKELQKTAKDKKKKEKEYNKQREEVKKQDVLRYDLKSMLKEISPNADYRYDEEQKTLEVRYFGKWEGDDGSGDYDWQTPTKETVEQIRKIKDQFKKKFGYELSSDWGEKNWYYFELKDKSKNSLTEKEITMSVLNELESFVKGIIKNAEDEKEKEEAKNEDKRKLIDEVGGILKGKVDDEIIRTIMKKMEEASYEPSEDKKADNEADEEEKEEKFEEEKKIANKCKNEEEEKEDKVEDEDDEKDEDDEVDKEEVKNKCKNSMKNVKKIIMGGKSKIESNYISKAERFALGEKY